MSTSERRTQWLDHAQAAARPDGDTPNAALLAELDKASGGRTRWTAAEAAVNIDLRKNVSTWNAPCGYKSRELSSTARRAPMMHINKR